MDVYNLNVIGTGSGYFSGSFSGHGYSVNNLSYLDLNIPGTDGDILINDNGIIGATDTIDNNVSFSGSFSGNGSNLDISLYNLLDVDNYTSSIQTYDILQYIGSKWVAVASSSFVTVEFLGSQGPQGWQGFLGSQGPQGWQGFLGPQGPQGWQGFTGIDGNVGSNGPQGYQGPQGWQGFTGTDGNVGSNGPQGYQGPQGVLGQKGQKGEQGSTGQKGQKGQKGDVGQVGNVGSNGLQGPQGYRGWKGPLGDKGDKGNSDSWSVDTECYCASDNSYYIQFDSVSIIAGCNNCSSTSGLITILNNSNYFCEFPVVTLVPRNSFSREHAITSIVCNPRGDTLSICYDLDFNVFGVSYVLIGKRC